MKARSDWLLKFQLSFVIHGLRSIKIVIVAGINVETVKRILTQLLISVSVASGDYSLSRKAVQ